MDSAGNVYVTGRTLSTDFPASNPLQPASAGGSDGFIAAPAGNGALVFLTKILIGNSKRGREALDGSVWETIVSQFRRDLLEAKGLSD